MAIPRGIAGSCGFRRSRRGINLVGISTGLPAWKLGRLGGDSGRLEVSFLFSSVGISGMLNMIPSLSCWNK